MPKIVYQATLCGCFRAIVGEMDDDIDKQLDLINIHAEPLNPIVH